VKLRTALARYDMYRASPDHAGCPSRRRGSWRSRQGSNPAAASRADGDEGSHPSWTGDGGVHRSGPCTTGVRRLSYVRQRQVPRHRALRLLREGGAARTRRQATPLLLGSMSVCGVSTSTHREAGERTPRRLSPGWRAAASRSVCARVAWSRPKRDRLVLVLAGAATGAPSVHEGHGDDVQRPSDDAVRAAARPYRGRGRPPAPALQILPRGRGARQPGGPGETSHATQPGSCHGSCHRGSRRPSGGRD